MTFDHKPTTTDAEQIDLDRRPHFWRRDFAYGSYLYLSRTDEGGLYVEIRNGPAILRASTTEADAASVLEWLARSGS